MSYHRDVREREAMDVTGYDHLVEVSFGGRTTFTVRGEEFSVTLDGPAVAFEVRRGNHVLPRESLRPLLEGLARSAGGGTPTPLMTVKAEASGLGVKVVFRNLSVQRQPDGRLAPSSGWATMLLRIR